MLLFKLSFLPWLHFVKLAADAFVLLVLLPHGEVFVQILIRIGRPCRPPPLGVAFVVPVGGVLPVVLIAAFPVRDSLSVLIQIIDLAAFCAPPAVIIQRVDGEQDMYMGVPESDAHSPDRYLPWLHPE